MSSEIRSQKKMNQESESSISSLPEEIFIDIIARVPRCYYPTLSEVSKRLRSLVASSELYDRRSFFKCTEQCLYVAISKDQTSDIHWFTLCRKPTGDKTKEASDYRLVHISSLPPMPLHGSYVSVESNVFVLGGFCDWRIKPSVSVIDCRLNRAKVVSDMPKAVAGSVSQVVDGKIYVIGGSDDTNSPMKSPSRTMMVFDLQSEVWELKMRPDWEQGKKWFGSVTIDGKIYMKSLYSSFVYDPKEGGSCERDELLHKMEWSNSCVVDGVLYYYDVRGNCLRGFDPKKRCWEVVKGLDGVLPRGCLWSHATGFNGGTMALFLQKEEIWCAEIAVERREEEGGEIWGKVKWCDVVLGGNFHVMGCVAVKV